MAAIVNDAGGKVVGRTRLQKIAYLLELAGVGGGFAFEYRHYGPYSEDLANSTKIANMFGVLKEKERPTSWGGVYSIFTVTENKFSSGNEARCALARLAAAADAVELELAATAAFLASKGEDDPWLETKARKPEKADDGRLEKAKRLYKKLSDIKTPVSLPKIS